jgi:hypothetical protein
MDGQTLLREVAGLIGGGWCCGAAARTGVGSPVEASDPGATNWSLTGALAAVADRPEFDITALRHALWGISAVIPDSSLDDWNNAEGRTQGDLLEMLARAETSLNEDPAPNNGSSLSPG